MSDIGQQLIENVRAKAAEDPDFRYQPPTPQGSCVYVYRGRPSCLIGHALWGAGLINRDFVRPEVSVRGVVSRPNEEGFSDIVSFLGLELDPLERMWLESVQAHQDDERPWGEAVEAADDMIKELDE